MRMKRSKMTTIDILARRGGWRSPHRPALATSAGARRIGPALAAFAGAARDGGPRPGRLAAVDHRLVLWDIDGTLLRGGEVGTEVFDRALLNVFGRLPDGRVQMSGKTDPQIVREYLGLLQEDDVAQLPEVLKHLELELAAAADRIATEGHVCRGVPALLERLAGDGRVVQSVLTGNIAPNAVVKLAAFGLEKWLDLEAGAFGSDHEDRRELVQVALRRQRELRDRHFDAADAWVVGDTPNDLAAARAGGAHCILVATGRFGLDELEPLGADRVLADLADTDAVVELLTGT
jgi:phosphoglycolate phosphatase-like HAD superfamily hydrolase